KSKSGNNLKIFMLAQILCLLAVPLARSISPRALIDGVDVYLAWLPLSLMLAIILLFGRRGIIPVITSFALVNALSFDLTFLQQAVLLFCQVFTVFAACGALRLQLGRRWRYGVPNRRLGVRLFWLGFIIPPGIK